jgi:hypothetical protein
MYLCIPALDKTMANSVWAKRWRVRTRALSIIF